MNTFAVKSPKWGANGGNPALFFRRLWDIVFLKKYSEVYYGTDFHY